MLWGARGVKAALKYVDEIDPRSTMAIYRCGCNYFLILLQTNLCERSTNALLIYKTVEGSYCDHFVSD